MFKTVEGYGEGGFAASLTLADAMTQPLRAPAPPSPLTAWRARFADHDLVVDLGQDIGTRRWWRGMATMLLLSGAALALVPRPAPIPGMQQPVPVADEDEQLTAQMITPLAFGGDSGGHMAATDAVVPLKAPPERPSIDVTATLGAGDGFARLLERHGAGGDDADAVAAMVAKIVPLTDIEPGTRVDMTLGRRSAADHPRPIDRLAMRARFDLALSIERRGGTLVLSRHPIAVDDTPLRVEGPANGSIYRAARAAGAPAEAVEKYLRVIQEQTPVAGIMPDDRYDMVIGYRRAATGEVEVGDLLYAGLTRADGHKIQMLRWHTGGEDRWFEASGVGQNRGQFVRPVDGGITSGYGMRFHPILGFMRMHRGVDFHAPYGEPIRAAAAGTVVYAGRKGGYGNFVELRHSAELGTGYAHMSRILARPGEHVAAGQVIGYVGATGLATGPHLHWEVYRDGHAINPMGVRFTMRAQLSGRELAAFRARLRQLTAVKVGAALASFHGAAPSRPVPPAGTHGGAPVRHLALAPLLNGPTRR